MAESNVLGTYKFPPNVFDKVLDKFSQAVKQFKMVSIISLITSFGVN